MSTKKGTPEGRHYKPRVNATPFDISTVQFPDWIDMDAIPYLQSILPKLSNIIDETDLPSVFMMANSYAMITQSYKQLHNEGLIVDGVKGRCRNPLIQIIKDQTHLYANLAARFGFTPADRARMLQLTSQSNEADDGLMNLIKEMNA